MKWTKILKDSEGNYDAFDWSLKDSFNVGILTIIFTIIFGIAFLAILPMFILFIYPMSIPRHRRQQTLIGLGATLLWFLDYLFIGLNYELWGSIFPSTYVIVTILQACCLIIFIGLLFLDRAIFDISIWTKIPILFTWYKSNVTTLP